MTRQFTVLPSADRDLDRQAEYLAREASLETALRFYDAAKATFAMLADMPELGERRESTNPALEGLRMWRIQGFEKHIIFYRTLSDCVEIVRVLHGARDLARALGEDRD